jgi:hypothetical protein
VTADQAREEKNMASIPNAAYIHQGPGKVFIDVAVPATINDRLVIDINGNPLPAASFTAWVLETVYNIGDQRLDGNSNVQQVVNRTGDFKSGATAPTWATVYSALTTDDVLTWMCIGAPTGGTYMGASEGAKTLTAGPKVEEITADEEFPPIDARPTAEAFEVDAVFKETDFTKLALAFTSGTLATGTDANLPATAQNYEELAFGGLGTITTHSIAVISSRYDVTGKFVVTELYKAYQSEVVKLPFQRGKETTYAVKFKGLSIPSRAAGDKVGKIYRQV